MGEEKLATQVRQCFETNTAMPSALHDAAMQLYRQYLVVGGMPECVLQFAQTRDYILIRNTQDTILASYLNDMSKYNNLNEIKKTRLAYDNITVQLSKKNTRFQYKLIKKGGRASEFENAIDLEFISRINEYTSTSLSAPDLPASRFSICGLRIRIKIGGTFNSSCRCRSYRNYPATFTLCSVDRSYL